jgi:hypothetical protein
MSGIDIMSGTKPAQWIDGIYNGNNFRIRFFPACIKLRSSGKKQGGILQGIGNNFCLMSLFGKFFTEIFIQQSRTSA